MEEKWKITCSPPPTASEQSHEFRVSGYIFKGLTHAFLSAFSFPGLGCRLMSLRRQGVHEAKAIWKRWVGEKGMISQWLRRTSSQERSVALERSSTCVPLPVSMIQATEGPRCVAYRGQTTSLAKASPVEVGKERDHKTWGAGIPDGDSKHINFLWLAELCSCLIIGWWCNPLGRRKWEMTEVGNHQPSKLRVQTWNQSV